MPEASKTQIPFGRLRAGFDSLRSATVAQDDSIYEMNFRLRTL